MARLRVSPHSVTGGRIRQIFSALLMIALFSAIFFGEVRAATGVVVYTSGACDYFIAESWMGFALLEWYGGPRPVEGDILVGDFESLGRTVVYNLTQDSDFTVWGEDFWLTRKKVIEKYWQLCPK